MHEHNFRGTGRLRIGDCYLETATPMSSLHLGREAKMPTSSIYVNYISKTSYNYNEARGSCCETPFCIL
jgi:hypothetical protein